MTQVQVTENNGHRVTLTLANEQVVGTSGQRVDIVLPSGRVVDLWIYETPGTTSVDVRQRSHVLSETHRPIVRTLDLPGCGQPTKCVGVVLAHRDD